MLCPVESAPLLSAALSSLALSVADPVAVFGGEGSNADKRRRCRSELRRMVERYTALEHEERFNRREREAGACHDVAVNATAVLLVHFPRLSTYTAAGDNWGVPLDNRPTFTPARAPAADRTPQTAAASIEAYNHGARIEWDYLDARAAAEGHSVEFLADLNDTPAPVLPNVARGRMIEAAYNSGRFNPWADRSRNKGHFQKQNAIKASERVAKGGKGKREIRTREDKARWAVKAAARRLDVLEANAGANPLLAQAIAIVRGILRPCAN